MKTRNELTFEETGDDADDPHHFRRLLRKAFRDHGIALHPLLLMENHFHLLVRPDPVGTLSRVMGWLGLSCVRPSARALRRRVMGGPLQGTRAGVRSSIIAFVHLTGPADDASDRGEMNAEVSGNLRIAVLTCRPRRPHGGRSGLSRSSSAAVPVVAAELAEY